MAKIISNQNLWATTCFIIIFSVILYFQHQSLDLDFFYDDYAVFRAYSTEELAKAFYMDLAKITSGALWVSAYRPFSQLMYHVAYKICGFDSHNLHMMIIALQIIQTILAFLFFRMLLYGKNTIALASSLLFSLNPNLYWHFTWNTEIPAMSGMIPFFLSLIALVSYIRRPDNLKIFIHCIFAVWAYLTKETYAPLFFITILTVIYYKKDNYRQYYSIIGWHGTVFLAYLTARFLVLGKWGGNGVTPDNYSGISKYFLNYFNFIINNSLWGYYKPLGVISILFYTVIITVFLIALNYMIAFNRRVKPKLLFIILAVYLTVPLYGVFNYIDSWKVFSQLKHIRGFLFLYLFGLLVITQLILLNRRKDAITGIQSSWSILRPGESLKKLQKEDSWAEEKEALIKYFKYSCLFTLIAGIPMFFLPDQRIMNVTSVGMGAAYGVSFFIVMSLIEGNISYKAYNSHKCLTSGYLRYTLAGMLILFVLVNGYIFRYNITGPASIYKAKHLEFDIYSNLDDYMIKHRMVKQKKYLFNKMVSQGFIDETTGQLIEKQNKN